MVVCRTPNTYKANVNRTKTRKWVEAKVQSYDGDDWGADEYDDYEDGNDQHDPEPEPLPAPASRPTGPRQLGPAGHQLPSSRTFSQPAVASLPSNANPRMFGSSTLRVQTQPAPPATTSPPYATESAHPTTTSSSHTNVPLGPYSAGPASTPSRFPPRKSSLSQQDRPEINDRTTSKPNSRPGSSSANRPWVDQRSASPSGGPTPAAKTLPIVRPADIYKRVGEEKEKERLSMESGRPSLDSLLGRTEGTSSSNQLYSSGERRRTSFESHDGSESARAPKSTLAPVAERRSEYGMDGFLIRVPTGQSPGPAASSPELSQPQNGPSDEVKADLLKSRRFSTSPQLPILSRVSGFGDDFFSSSSSLGSQAAPKLLSPSEEPRSPQNEMNAKTMSIDGSGRQPPRALEEATAKPSLTPAVNEKSELAKEGTQETTQTRLSSTRPQLPGAWVSESLTVSAPSEQSTPMEKQEAQGLGRLANLQSISVSPMTEISMGPSSTYRATNNSNLPSAETPQYTLDVNSANQFGAEEPASAAGQHNDAINPKPPAIEEHQSTPQSLPPLKTETLPAQSWSRPISTVSPTPGDKSPQKLTSTTAQPANVPTTISEFSPTAPLNTNRAQAGRPDIILPSTQLRKSTISTIETTSPEKESDKLREEIMKSLSTTPVSPGSSGLAPRDDSEAEPTPGDLARESTYLAGVYDDYLSLGEEKSLQELSQAAKESTSLALNQPTRAEHGSAPEPRDISAAQPAPLNSAKSPPLENTKRARRFSWQQDTEEVNLGPVESEPVVSVFPQESLAHNQGIADAETNTKTDVTAPASDSLQAGTRATGTISHQVSDVSSRGPEDASLAAIESPSPISFIAARPLKPASEEQNVARLSLAEEKEMVLIGDAQSTRSSVSEQHPALTQPPEQEDEGPSPGVVAPDVAPTEPRSAPTPFRDILNLATYEQRVQKFEETREQFYVMDSGLSDWLTYLQSQPEHSDTVASYNTSVGAYNASSLLSKAGAQTMSGATGASQPPYKTGTAASHPRRSSISNMQQLIAGSSSGFGASGAQVGTKSKELFHAAGAFGNKGMKSGMKLFNKGKNKLRERAAGDKAFF
ncbi:hypothetical protein FHL15_002660 [Xylaria flabelliformis]|uniref:Uncharacterized protein n=1 Tax=Xylaria flabelliformis TaxID=2512241 RepID=A0A553I859_9PEZI|nr:hypothetical protein FHL15_002660 [Xylaria flabelliformis]